MLRSWRDYLPDRDQARQVVTKALEKAELTSRGLADADDRTCAEALVEVAADAFRLLAITMSNDDPWRRFGAAFDRARAGLDRDPPPTRRAIAGVLAFSSLVLSRGGYIQGHYDRTTCAGLQREITWLELATRLPSSDGDVDRLLGFAALAAGRGDLALELSKDEALARLAAALAGPPAEAREAFIAFLDAFNTAAHGYPELGFVARAYVVHVEERGDGGIGAAIDWLREAIHIEPRKLVSYAPRPAGPYPAPKPTIPDDLAARLAPLVASGEHADRAPARRLSFRTLHFADVHSLWGGRSIEIRGDGRVEAYVGRGGGGGWHYRARLSDAGVAEIEALVRRWPIRAIPPSTRNGIAGEAFPILAIEDAEGKHTVGRWARDPNPAFSALAHPLDELAQYVSATVAPVPEEALRAERALSPGKAFYLAYLPARRVIRHMRLKLCERHALAPAALDADEAWVVDSDRHIKILAREADIALPSPSNDVPEWLTALAGALRPHLRTPLHEAAWKAGEAARFVAIGLALVATVAELRISAPEDAALPEQATSLEELYDAVTLLKARLEATCHRAVIAGVIEVLYLLDGVCEIGPGSADAAVRCNDLARKLDAFVEASATRFDADPTAHPLADDPRLYRALRDNAFREALPSSDPVRHFLLRAGAFAEPLYEEIDYTDWDGSIVWRGPGSEIIRGATPPDPTLPFADLEALLGMGDFARRLVAGHPSTPADTLLVLAEDPDYFVQRKVLSRPQNDAAVLERLRHSRSPVIAAHFEGDEVLESVKTDDELRACAADADARVRRAVARRVPLPDDLFEKLAGDSCATVRTLIAGRPDVTPAAVRRLLQREVTREIALVLAKNPATPADALRDLRHKGPDLRTELARRPSLPRDLALAFARDQFYSVRSALAQNPTVDPDILGHLLDDELLRISVADNPRFDRLAELATDPSSAVRTRVAARMDAPREVLELLSRDSEMRVRRKASETLRALAAAPQPRSR